MVRPNHRLSTWWSRMFVTTLVVTLFLPFGVAHAQHSVARQWNELLLDAIRGDYARPTVHARNLFHASVAMYDAWAILDATADTYFLGKTVDGFNCTFDGMPAPADVSAAREEAVSYAAYRILTHRFANSPGVAESQAAFDALMSQLGYDTGVVSTDYSSGSAAALGNYIAQCLIQFGLQDGANEAGDYENLHYEPANPTLIPIVPGNPDIVDPNRWQPLTLEVFIDQSGHVIADTTLPFLSPEWGVVSPFALQDEDLTVYQREGNEYWVYHDPGTPPMLDTLQVGGLSQEYKWGFELVSIWSSHLDPADGVLWDISPGAIGNIPSLPQSIAEYRDFYDLFDGGDPSLGHAVNPHTGLAYEPQMVPRADYARVLAEFWADGPDSETPPGHWFTILNYVNDHPLFEKRFRGEGPVVDDLEWDVKAYFLMGGTMHDAAVAAWGIKGWYDYIRPISALRCMTDRGQSSDHGLPRFDPGGITLVPGFIEMVQLGDPLAGDENENVDKIKLLAWRGPDWIDDPATDVAGVDWILADNWWPYQRPSFVTPPFAGYVSGHSTYSRAAAVIMELLTGDAFFPGGMGEFHAPQNEFLVFEDGPSVDLTLQWATYRDASDQTSLSRIWGGIHPPADDIPGRIIGEAIGADAFALAEKYFEGMVTAILFEAFNAARTVEGVSLHWSVFADEDYVGFRVYRAEGGDPTLRLLTPEILSVSTREYVDVGARAGESYRYKLAVVRADASETRSNAIAVAVAPLKLSLSQNVPNPFNPTTTIRYTVPEQAHVSLRIYNAAGRLVRTLVDARMAPGSREAIWYGNDDAGNPVSSGVYIYRLRAGAPVLVKKMTLLR